MDKVILDDGKYEVQLNNINGDFKALRYGKEWRKLTGDKLMLSMFFRILELEDKLFQATI